MESRVPAGSIQLNVQTVMGEEPEIEVPEGTETTPSPKKRRKVSIPRNLDTRST